MKKYILSKLHLLQSSSLKKRKCQKSLGLTTTEMIVTTVIASITLTAALTGFSSSRQVYLEGQNVNRLNQRLRNAVSVIGTDLQRTGENLVADPHFPAIEIIQQTIPNSTDKTSELIIRKGSVVELPICQTINAGTSNPIVVVDNDSTDGNCKFNEDLDNTEDGIPDVVKRWQDLRDENKGKIEGYIFDGAGKGEYFTYTDETFNNDSGVTITPSKTNLPHEVVIKIDTKTWTNTYQENTTARIYILDEIRYQINDENTLQSVRNNEDPLSLVENIERIEVKATLQLGEDGKEYVCDVLPPVNSGDCSPSLPTGTNYSWNLIKHLEVKGVALVDPEKDKSLSSLREEDLEFSQKFFPRNAYSF